MYRKTTKNSQDSFIQENLGRLALAVVKSCDKLQELKQGVIGTEMNRQTHRIKESGMRFMYIWKLSDKVASTGQS